MVKVGSSALAAPGAVARLAAEVASVRASGKSVVVVSSGAIALGWPKLGYKSRPKPKEVAKLQASAAAGQSVLMRAYEEAFAQSGIPVAQVLLTHADLADRARANNARAALAELLAAGAVPVLNENDSVAVEEIKFGDNDQLAALVVPLVDAELLVLLSDVDGVLDAEGKRIAEVADANEVKRFVKASASTASTAGTGGMASKIEAARRATLAGAHVVITDARRARVLEEVTSGADVGTWFAASGSRMNARRYWIAFTLRPRGDVVLDAGAADAVKNGNKSVLCVGVLGVRGDFREGDAVRLLAPTGDEIGRGLVRLDATDAARAAGRKEQGDGILVHRDDLVVS